jgi:hypothetical protein
MLAAVTWYSLYFPGAVDVREQPDVELRPSVGRPLTTVSGRADIAAEEIEGAGRVPNIEKYCATPLPPVHPNVTVPLVSVEPGAGVVSSALRGAARCEASVCSRCTASCH